MVEVEAALLTGPTCVAGCARAMVDMKRNWKRECLFNRPNSGARLFDSPSCTAMKATHTGLLQRYAVVCLPVVLMGCNRLVHLCMGGPYEVSDRS